MPKLIGPEVEILVRHLSKQGFSFRAISDHLKRENFDVSFKTIGNIINCIGYRRNHKLVGLPSPEKPQPKGKVTKRLIREVDVLTDEKNPPSQVSMSQRFNVSRRTIGRIIHQELKKKTKRKVRVHALQESHKKRLPF